MPPSSSPAAPPATFSTSSTDPHAASLGDPEFAQVGATRLAYRKVGSGDPLLLLHGWPLTGLTFRGLLPALAARFTCYAIDFPGAGDSAAGEGSVLGMRAQAETAQAFVRTLGLGSYGLLAHDTGATIGRQLAIIDAGRVQRAVFIGTEIPHHRPPWIPFFQRLSSWPGADYLFQRTLRSSHELRSARGFGGCFSDLSLIEGDFHRLFIAPLIRSAAARAGQRARLRGIDWKLVDSLALGHGQIQAPVLLLWGEDDPVFPVALARRMVAQFRDCRGLTALPGAKLFVHEERPEQVARECLAFLRG